MSAIRPFRLFALAALMAAPAIYADGLKGDAAAGKALFMSSSCPTCHAVTKDDTSKVGPNLVGVLGRRAGTKKSLLGPSENMKKYGVIWSAETLDEFLDDFPSVTREQAIAALDLAKESLLTQVHAHPA